MNTWAIAIHGGADYWLERHDAATLTKARAGLHRALTAAAAILEQNGAALDAAIAAVRVLEDDPCFNAGIGAALTEKGTVEHDAGIMRGSDGAFGAVANVRRLRSPIEAARRVLEDGRHVLLVGDGAEQFAIAHGCELADPAQFITVGARAALLRKQQQPNSAESKGTVGAVVRDNAGQLIAATSTGGLTGKRCGRVGDSPIPGGGTWADGTCAISSTGDGELFLRICFAFTAAQAIAGGMAGEKALHHGLQKVAALGGVGGAIVMPAQGAPQWSVINNDLARGMYVAGDVPRVALGINEPFSS